MISNIISKIHDIIGVDNTNFILKGGKCIDAKVIQST